MTIGGLIDKSENDQKWARYMVSTQISKLLIY